VALRHRENQPCPTTTSPPEEHQATMPGKPTTALLTTNGAPDNDAYDITVVEQ
jgi:hypothetical protein